LSRKKTEVKDAALRAKGKDMNQGGKTTGKHRGTKSLVLFFAQNKKGAD